MAKEELIQLNGKVLEAQPNALFKVKLENGLIIMTHLNGKIRKNNIRISEGDLVLVEISPYDMSKGRIKFRL